MTQILLFVHALISFLSLLLVVTNSGMLFFTLFFN